MNDQNGMMDAINIVIVITAFTVINTDRTRTFDLC